MAFSEFGGTGSDELVAPPLNSTNVLAKTRGAVAHPTARNVVEAVRQLVHLRAVVEHPPFVVMEHLAVVVVEIEPRGDAKLAFVGKTVRATGLSFCLAQCRQQ